MEAPVAKMSVKRTLVAVVVEHFLKRVDVVAQAIGIDRRIFPAPAAAADTSRRRR
jgi:hypothetical protein